MNMLSTSPATDVADALAVLRERLPADAPDLEVALILGSGLGALADALTDAVACPTGDLPGYPRSTVAGHTGRLVVGTFEGRRVLAVQGRVHYYEGHPECDLAFPVRIAHAMGAKRLIVTNAAGGIHPSLAPGTLMFITDQINFAFRSPLAGPNTEGGPRFVDLSDPYDPDWLDAAEQIALQLKIPTQRGVYLWNTGPTYETPAEIRMYARLGADAVGMSTVPEVLQARYYGMKVLGISAITNRAAGLHHAPLNHEEVLEVGQRVRGDFERLLRAVVARSL